MDIIDKIKLFFLTIFIDLVLCLISLFELDYYNLLFIYSLLLTHIIFIISLIYELNLVLKIIHHLVFFYPILSLLITNLYLKLLNLGVIIVVQILWIIEGRCILSETKNEFGYGELTSYFVWLLTFFLLLNILQLINI